ncbi:MAG: APC family permease, partial [Saccharolobus sp.]
FNSLNWWNYLLTIVINTILGFVIFANIVTTAVNTFVLIGVGTFIAWMLVGIFYGYMRKVLT